jgi:hypothetical protein
VKGAPDRSDGATNSVEKLKKVLELCKASGVEVSGSKWNLQRALFVVI